MYYPDYLIHYNKNHSKANGQFVSGDGDGDGISNDHAHRSNNSSGRGRNQISSTSSSKHMSRKRARAIRNSGIAMVAAAAGLQTANVASGDMVPNWVHNVAAGIVAADLVVGTTQIVRGAVSMGKASRRGDKS